MNTYSKPVDKCPIGKGVSMSTCKTCDYCERIGFCAYPAKICSLIAQNKEAPMDHDHTWPALVQDYCWRFDKATQVKQVVQR